MASEEASTERSTERSVVKTYVPAYQKDAWTAHAERLDMSQSEFVRTMVQAGRHAIEDEDPADVDLGPTTVPATKADTGGDAGESPTTGADRASAADLEHRVVDALREERRSWDDLVAYLTDNLEDRLEEVLDRLQDDNRVRHSGRHGGYTLQEGGDGE